MTFRRAERLVGEGYGWSVRDLNVCGYVRGNDGLLMSLDCATTDEDDVFGLEAGWWDAPGGDSLPVRFEVLDCWMPTGSSSDGSNWIEKIKDLFSQSARSECMPAPGGHVG